MQNAMGIHMPRAIMEPLAFTPAQTGSELHYSELEHAIQKTCGRYRLAPRPGGRMRMRGAVEAFKLGRFDTAAISLSCPKVSRLAQDIRVDPQGTMFMLIQDSGQCEVIQNNQRFQMYPGDMVLAGSDDPSEFRYLGGDSRQISISFDRDEMVARFGEVCAGGLQINRNDPLWVAIRAVLVKAVSEQREEDISWVSETLMSLIGSYTYRMRVKTPQRRDESQYVYALQLIDQHYRDPDFGPRALAEMLNLPDRTLQRYFKAFGETPGRRLTKTRFEAARARLQMAWHGTRPCVTSAAYDCGFNDLSGFYRQYRKHFGETPGQTVRGAFVQKV